MGGAFDPVVPLKRPNFCQRLRTVSVAGNQRRAFARQRKTVRAASGWRPAGFGDGRPGPRSGFVWFLDGFGGGQSAFEILSFNGSGLENLAAPFGRIAWSPRRWPRPGTKPGLPLACRALMPFFSQRPRVRGRPGKGVKIGPEPAKAAAFPSGNLASLEAEVQVDQVGLGRQLARGLKYALRREGKVFGPGGFQRLPLNRVLGLRAPVLGPAAVAATSNHRPRARSQAFHGFTRSGFETGCIGTTGGH